MARKAFVSMIGFMFLNTRVPGVKWPFHVNFEEVNLRFYVKHFDGVQCRRGAIFISELVLKALIPLVANNLYNEHYKALPIRHSVTPLPSNETTYMYEWKLNGNWNRLGATVGNTFIDIAPNSAEEFIFEHYWGYNAINSTTTLEYAVEHVPWQIAPVSSCTFGADVAQFYGETFVPYLKQPYSMFFAKGSDVIVRVVRKIQLKQKEG
nr:DUF2071 domain-containing protein [Mucilaginibacter robiniae]